MDSLGRGGGALHVPVDPGGRAGYRQAVLTAKHGFLARRISEFAEAEKMIFDTIRQIKEDRGLVNP